MSVFELYAAYYDLLYRDKDYGAEAKYIADFIYQYSPKAKTILELGCGTGAHAAQLAVLDFDVTGIDMSESMLDRAKERRAGLGADIANRLQFALGDVRTCRLDVSFDVVISLFHVFSYQTTNEDLLAAFQTAATHLRPGGLLIFDYWFGPAVLTQRPEVRIKRFEDEQFRVMRVAEPTMNPVGNRVTVEYLVQIDAKTDGRSERVQERHDMRYLFIPEIESLSSRWFMPEAHYAWLTRRTPGISDWAGVTVLVRRR